MQMSDDALIRLANLKALGYTPSQLVKLIGYSYQYWRDLMTGNKSFGEKAARNIEEKLGLPRGCMDLAQGCNQNEAASLPDSNQAKPSKYNVSPVPSLADTLAQLGQVIAASDKLTRAQIKPILDQLLEHPEQALELGARLQATIAIQQEQSAPLLPGVETKDFLKKKIPS